VKPVALLHWAAWSPGIEDEEAWRAWAAAPHPLQRVGAPDVRFLPALQRRRCDPLSRMMLHAAHAGCPQELLSEVSSVFASRHGSLGTMTALLQSLALDEPVSPTRFSHCVHNTQAGLFSIWAGNPRASTCVAAGEETFAHGFLEAISMLEREPERPVLYVMGDERAPEPLTDPADGDAGAYALALLLSRPQDAGAHAQATLAFELEATHEERPAPGPVDALRFLRWLISDEPDLRISRSTHAWVWRR
jgi:hypothetical protein